ncbi:hypothetical protein [Microbacterium sp. JAI119]|uniref:hypothetical protein n=1 Tax=Microbacterium sp. JAI119 TaxID=2723062 RepID=UPI0015CB1737|nr:hypothetical protein [Microbacterium sp. JAI119]NYF28058.1 hypothetical protein [Microbacterium sp. JAI119]
MLRVLQSDSSLELAQDVVCLVPLRRDPETLVGYVDDELREECRQKLSSNSIGGVLVECARVHQELEIGQCAVGAMLEAIGRELEFLLDGGTLEGRLLDACPDLAHRQGAGCRELDKTFFLCFELLELFLELCLHVPILGEDVRDRRG